MMKRMILILSVLMLALAVPASAQQPKKAKAAQKARPQRPAPDPAFTAAVTDAAIESRIRELRTAQATLTLADASGKPLADAPVTIRQTRHKFLFGTNAFGLNPSDTSRAQLDYQKRLADLMNYATLPFYWGSFEFAEGQPQTERLRAMAEWCRAHGITVKGHPLCWTQVPPRWLSGRGVDEMKKTQLARIRRDVGAFEGLVGVWDVVNEATWLGGDRPGQDNPVKRLFQGVGTVEMIKLAFDEARKADPSATLILNDYKKEEDFRSLVERCLKAGVPIDVIGIQSHQHGRAWPAEDVWATCERFKGFGLPVHFTETTFLSGPFQEPAGGGEHYTKTWPTTPEGEKTQAANVARFYRILFSHPAVQAITWWDLSDTRAWKRAPAGLVRADMSPKPAYDELLKLVKGAWWTGEVKATTDGQGRVSFRGFLGDYALETEQGKAVFALGKAGETKVAVKLKSKN